MKKIILLFLIVINAFAAFYVQTIKVEKKSLKEQRSYYGKVVGNENLFFTFTSRVDGFITELNASQSYENISKDSKLFSLYSAELLQAQNEYINALKFKNNIQTTKEKLLLLGVSPKVIELITKNKKAFVSIPFYANTQGVIFEKNITHGAFIKKGESLYKFLDLSTLWFVAKVPQEQIEFFSQIDSAEVKINGFKKAISMEFLQIIPQIQDDSKLVEIRFLLQNPKNSIFPNLFGKATIFQKAKEILFVPKESVLLRNEKLYVFAKNQEGEFEPIEIEGKKLAGGDYEILSGLEGGEEIAKNALFILDSDAQANGGY
ncbi:hemolysin D [Helicobacter cholecystus]|uniref:Hemolysin D n=1 Tax=Helicobacter cholecystus TaxID=45498 RepID=A0A3D8IW07_9HELI|nr:efflux RND transporter periplasmic adaptor subunit [Helicobacter cholecystus]RDU69469.1 hemolysin D [Helicobacter cholecystus]VEJ24020.1 putative copper resistance determinant CrdC [Helicobacter cholecystus]